MSKAYDTITHVTGIVLERVLPRANSVTCSADGRWVARATSKTIYLSDREVEHELTGMPNAQALFSPDSSTVLLKTTRGKLAAYDVRASRPVLLWKSALKGNDRPQDYGIAFGPGSDPVVDLVFGPGWHGTVRVLRAVTGEVLHNLTDESLTFTDVRWVPSRKRFLVLGYGRSADNVHDRDVVGWLDPASGDLDVSDLGSDGQDFAEALWWDEKAGDVVVWTASSVRAAGRRLDLGGSMLGLPALSPDGRYAVVAGSQMPIIILRYPSLETAATIPLTTTDGWASGPSFSHGGQRLLVVVDGRACVYDVSGLA